MKNICIFLEQYLIPQRYKDNIKRFIYSLSNKHNIIVFSPNIDIICNININNIKTIHLHHIMTLTSPTFNMKFDILILFSTYNKSIYFDRRSIIMNILSYSHLLMIPSHNILDYNILLKNNIPIIYFTTEITEFLLCKKSYIAKSLFDTDIDYTNNEITLFYDKYKINNDIKIIAFIPGPLDLWYKHDFSCNKTINHNIICANIFLNHLKNIKKVLKKENYIILGIKHYNDNYDDYNNIDITWIDDLDYNLLKHTCSGIITIANIDFYRYIKLNKPIIEIGKLPLEYYFTQTNIKLNNKVKLYFNTINKQKKFSFLPPRNINNLGEHIIQLIINYKKKCSITENNLDQLICKYIENINIPHGIPIIKKKSFFRSI